ncbi:MAG: hypothetical protein JST10_02250 [Bacteroidetes bacterium]|nr:hypothetical protein [Bacteroidota bacterium]
MANLFTQEFEDKYKGALSDKENSPFKDKIIQSLNDLVVQDEWADLKKAKSEIKDAQSFTKYVTDLKQFFNSICEKITAPGVDAFIEWLSQFGNLNLKNCNLLREHLINNYQYAEYADKIESIIENKNTIELSADNPRLFDSLLKTVQKSIKSEIDILLNKPDLFDTSSVPFLDAQSTRLESLSEINELSFTSINELYSAKQNEKNIAYYQDVVEDAVKYINDVKPAKYLGQDKIESDAISYRINDLRKLINALSGFGIASEKNPTLKIIFDKTKQLIVGKQGTLEQQWNEYENKIWNNLEAAHDTIAKFFLNKNDVNIELLVKSKTKWQLPEIQTDLNFLITKFGEVTKVNPLEGIDKIPAKDIAETLLKKQQSIEELNTYCISFKKNLFETLNSKVSDFESHKIPIVESILLTNPSIKKKLAEIKDNIVALKLVNSEDYSKKDFLNFLSNDFDSFYEIYETLDSTYTSILSNTGLKENIDWLNDKLQSSDELELTEGDLKDEAKLVALMKVNLIKVTLSKNI